MVPRSVRIGYGIGSFCTGTFSTVPGLLLLFYLTNHLAVPAWLAGVVVFAPKAWDMLINPFVGQLSDRGGSRRPWLLAGALALPPAFALTFAAPELRGVPAALYVGAFFFLAATAYAFFEVPYKAMPAEMTDDYHERSSLLQWRMIFLGMAILLSGAVAPVLAGGPGYHVMGVVVGVVLLAAMLGTYAGTARAPVVGHSEAEPSLARQLAVARTNKHFLTLLGLSCAQMLAAGTMLAAAPYLATYVVGDPEATTTLFASLVGPILLTMPLWVWLARRLDKKGAMLLSSALFLAGAAALVLTPALGAVYAHLCVLVVGVGYAGIQLLQFSMMADVIAHDNATTGRRRAGVFTGLWTACETVVFALGALVLSWVLGWGGFIESDPATPVRQPDSAILAVQLGGTLLPAACVAVALALTLRYRLTAAQMAARS
ncbi:MFS transporter [Thermoactinospora rubra]|uniref:MFS transporter n=1 Tax=Thermoactinospora rubra TaxID=1088767 RepID=UPI000A10EE59|nr:MFS transporter [Thermoactinospora rubra]